MSFKAFSNMVGELEDFIGGIDERVDRDQLARNQLQMIEDRTAAGLGIDGVSFRPLKDGSKAVVATSTIFSQARIEVEGPRACISFDGDVAKIVAKNDEWRPFWGATSDEKELLAAQALAMATGASL